MKKNGIDSLLPVRGAVFVGLQPNGSEFDVTFISSSGDYKFTRIKVLSYGDKRIQIVDGSNNQLKDELYCEFFMVGSNFKLPKLLGGKVGTITVIWRHDD